MIFNEDKYAIVFIEPASMFYYYKVFKTVLLYPSLVVAPSKYALVIAGQNESKNGVKGFAAMNHI